MFADFMFEAAGQIVPGSCQAALYVEQPDERADGRARRRGRGAQRRSHHSGAYHPVWAHVPGLIVCLPRRRRRQGLMKAALRASIR